MPPSDAAAIRRLLAEVQADRRALEERTEEIRRFSEDTDPLPSERPGALALALDRAYTALESMLDRIARTLEGGPPSGPDCHRTLLQNAILASTRSGPPYWVRRRWRRRTSCGAFGTFSAMHTA